MKRLFSPVTLFFLSAVFIFYATTIPWDVSRAPTLERFHAIPGWDSERNRIWSIPDMVQNVVLFVPFGFLFYFAFLRSKASTLLGATARSGLVGLGLSTFVESLQTMSASRSPATTDLLTNLTGAAMGGAIAAVYSSRLHDRTRAFAVRTLRQSPGVFVLLAYAAFLVLGSPAPFIPTLDVGMLRASVRSFLDNPWGPKPIGALLTDGLLFSSVAYLFYREAPGLLVSRGLLPRNLAGPNGRAGAAALTFFALSALALGLEGAQLVIVGHSPGLQDAVVGIGGVVVGTLVAAMSSAPTPAKEVGESSRTAPGLVLAFAVLLPILRALQPFQFGDLAERWALVESWSFVPFWAFFRNINLSTFRNVFEVSAVYVPLGYVLASRGFAPKLVFAAALGLAEVLELLQIPVLGRTFDVTEGIYAGAMALFGAHLLGTMRRAGDRH